MDRLIAEGGFGFVYQATDQNTGEKYALKKMIVTNENKRNI